MEAMACGTPCVGFNVGGIPEMIDHLHNGYVAEYRNAQDFANGISWVLDAENNAELGNMARRKVEEEYSENAIAQRYIEVYNKELRRIES
jgi:glycosyltransferase involved in cell wall biosynthesis